MTDPLRVTLVLPYGGIGGAQQWLLTLLDATDRLVVDAVVLGDGPIRGELAARGIPVELWPTGPRPHDLLAPTLRLAHRLRGNRPDVLLTEGLKAQLVATGAGWLTGARTVWSKHDHAFDGRLTRVLARLSDAVVVTSGELAAATGRVDAAVIPPPLPAGAPLARSTARRVLAASHGVALDDRPTMAIVGRLVNYKGIDDAIRALALPGGRAWQLVVVGADDTGQPAERDRLRALADTLGVSDRVLFTGEIPGVGRLLTAFDALAVLTKPAGRGLPNREGFGITALEAMAAGVPVIATEPGAVVPRLQGRAGIAVPVAAPRAVARALRTLTDPAVRAALGQAGRQLTAGHPDAAECADRLATLMAAVACRPGAGRDERPPVSVVTTVRDERTTVGGLLDALLAQLTVPGDEVIVVDGGSQDGTVELLRARAGADRRVRLLSRAGAGISAGRNIGIAAARNELVACTDAGCLPAPGWVDALRGAATEPADLLTGTYRVQGHSVIESATAVAGYPDPDELRWPTALVRLYGRLFGRTFDPSLPTGRSVAFRRPAWQTVGGFPEHLDTGEDVTFGRSIVAAGGRAVAVADAEVAWAQRPTFGGTLRMYYRYGEGSARSDDPLLLRRDMLRAAAYPLAAVALWRGGPAVRMAVLAGAAAYLSLPLTRAVRRRNPAAVAAAVPVVAAARDLAKAAGCIAAAGRRVVTPPGTAAANGRRRGKGW